MIYSKPRIQPIQSSASESESSTMSDMTPLYKSILDDYIGTKKGSLFKSIEKAASESTEKNIMKKYVEIYKRFHDEYTERAREVPLGAKTQKYMGIAEFCQLGFRILLNNNSSSIIERAFSDSCRCIKGQRTRLRNDFKTTH